jgi:CRISPR-associated protein Cas2
METHLVAYDICDPKRLRKVAKVCEDFGLSCHYSVFFCRLAAVDLVRLKSRLYDVIDLDRDQVLFIPLCARCAAAIESLGRPIEPHDTRDVVIMT